MPLLNAWTQQLGGMHINFNVNNGEIKPGYASFKPRAGDANDWLQALQKNAGVLRRVWAEGRELPTPINRFDNGKLTLGVTNLKVEVGGFVDALFNVSVEDMKQPSIDATADVDIKGMAKGQLKLANQDGKLVGQVSLAIDFKSFSGERQRQIQRRRNSGCRRQGRLQRRQAFRRDPIRGDGPRVRRQLREERHCRGRR